MIAIRTGVDQRRDRLVRDGLDGVDDRLTPPVFLGIDDDHACRRDEDGGISSSALEDVQVVFQLLDFDGLLPRILRCGGSRKGDDD
jgi:hypothetical protein